MGVRTFCPWLASCISERLVQAAGEAAEGKSCLRGPNVPERIANKIVLAEDAEQQNLVRRYLEKCGHNTRECRFVSPAAKGPGGSGEKYVRDQYPQQVQACRSSLGRRASALLIVIVDADTETTERRALQLSRALIAAGVEHRGADEPVVVLIPKRHVET